MKNFFRQLSFRRKLLISFVTLSCIPVLLVGIAAYHLYTNFISPKVNNPKIGPYV